ILRQDLPAPLESVLLRLLAADPADRFGSADEAASALLLSIASGAPAAADPGSEDGPPAILRGRFVGRDADWRRLRDPLDRALVPARLALLGGGPGSGKTRLLRELALHAKLSGALVAEASAEVEDLARPHGTGLALLRALEGALEGTALGLEVARALAVSAAA